MASSPETDAAVVDETAAVPTGVGITETKGTSTDIPRGSTDTSPRHSIPHQGHPIETPKPPPRITSRNYAHPYRPFPLGAVNTVGRALGKIGIRRSLNTEAIIKAAARAAGRAKGYTGLDDDYREGLEVLIDSIESEANLNPLGRMITRGRLVNALKARFRAEELMEKKPQVLEAPLSPPLIITGLQRTGTTLLHRLIAADARFRSLASWEVLDPMPPPPNRHGKDPRLKAAKRAERGAAWMSPDFFAVHPIDYKAPEEDVLLLDNTFRSTVAEAILNVPTYAAWLESTDSTPAYAFMRKIMLLLQAENPRPYWILKSPHHLEFLDVLRSVFPEAKIIQTHRDPAKTSGSFLSMVAHGYGMFTDSPNPAKIGRHWVHKCLRMVEKGRIYREALPPAEEKATFLDVYFLDLMNDPVGTLARIYDFAGIRFGDAEEAAAEAFLIGHGRHRFGKHVYDLADFGYSETSVRAAFAAYQNHYNIPNET